MMGSFSTIFIERSIPIINGYVRIPPNLPSQRLALLTETVLGMYDTNSIKLGIAGTASTAGKHGVQQMLKMPPVQASTSIDDSYNNVVKLANQLSSINSAIPIVYNSTNSIVFTSNSMWITFVPSSRYVDIIVDDDCTVDVYVGPLTNLTKLVSGTAFTYADASKYPVGSRLYAYITSTVITHNIVVEDD